MLIIGFFLLREGRSLKQRIDCRTDHAFKMNRQIKEWIRKYDEIRQRIYETERSQC